MGGCCSSEEGGSLLARSHRRVAVRREELEKAEDFVCDKNSPVGNVWRKEIMIDKDEGTYKPAIPLTHIISGQIKNGYAEGYHFRPNGQDPPSAKASEEISKCCKEIKCFRHVEVYDAHLKEYVKKRGTHNSFFPETWTLEETIKKIEEGFGKKKSEFKGDRHHVVLQDFDGLGFDIFLVVEKTQRNHYEIVTVYPVGVCKEKDCIFVPSYSCSNT